MKKDNWKLIKKLVSNYGEGKNQEEKKDEPKCIPIFVHKNTFPVSVNEKFINVFNGLYSSGWKKLKGKPLETPEGRYYFFISVIKKNINNFDYYWVKIVINNANDKLEPVVDEQLFNADKLDPQFRHYVTVPNRIFKISNEHRDILTFDGAEMYEKDYLEVVKKWMDQNPKK